MFNLFLSVAHHGLSHPDKAAGGLVSSGHCKSEALRNTTTSAQVNGRAEYRY